MNILLDDISFNDSLFPFGVVRSAVHIRIGILTIFEKWQQFFPGKVFIASEKLLRDIDRTDTIEFPGNFVPAFNFLENLAERGEKLPYAAEGKILDHPWQITAYNDWAIREDFRCVTAGRQSAKIPANSHGINSGDIFIEPGAKVSYSILNAEEGPVYVGTNAEIQEGSVLRGPVSIGEGSRVKMGTRIYGATTVGPYCLAGGEIKNSVLSAYSNKGHDGYLGDSVIGEWCNLGAGTSNSNLKNNASVVRIWSKKENDFVAAGTKCGLFMGDYSRAAINTSFNTGTVVGVCCSIFGTGMPPRFIDNFTWGSKRYLFEKALSDIQNWKQLKGRDLTEMEIQSLKKIY